MSCWPRTLTSFPRPSDSDAFITDSADRERTGRFLTPGFIDIHCHGGGTTFSDGL